VNPLAVLFVLFAALGLMIALAGHAGRAASVAPSMYGNELSPIGYAVMVICLLIALAAAATWN